MKKFLFPLVAILAVSTTAINAKATETSDISASGYHQDTATSPYFKGDVKLPPTFSVNDFTNLDKFISQSPRYSGYAFNKLDYVKDYEGKGSDLIILYGSEIVLIKKTGDQFEIKSASKSSDELSHSSKFYNINNQYYILQGLTDNSNISEYRLLKLDNYNLAQIGSSVATKGTDLPPASVVSLSLNAANNEPRIVFLEPQVWLQLASDSGNYRQNDKGLVTLELLNGQWSVVSGQKI